MPYTKTPMQSTEQNQTVNLLYNWDSRDYSSHNYDTLFQNAISEAIGKEYYQIMKRDGVGALTLPPPTGGITVLGNIVGTYYWTSKGGIPFLILVHYNVTTLAGWVSVFNEDPTTGTITAQTSNDLLTTVYPNSEVFFTEFLYDNGTVDVFFTVENKLFKIDH